MPPGEFIPVAEELGLIEAIGDWVIDEVARTAAGVARRAASDLEVSFNLSPRQLWTPRLAERLLATLLDAGVEPSTMQAEITESTAMADPDRTQRDACASCTHGGSGSRSTTSAPATRRCRG